MVTSLLCILPARYHSTRFPGKMLATLAGETLIARGWRIATETFGVANCVVAIPIRDLDGPLGDELRRIDATIYAFDGDERDLLARFYACAHTYRWHQQTVIVRYTPDDPFKRPDLLRAVVAGERHTVELGGEAFTLAQLDHAYHHQKAPEAREHLTYALFPMLPPTAPPGVWTIDAPEDLAEAEKMLERGRLSA